MGKSPGKWIKTVLFGKKASKSNSSKRREIPKSAFEKASSAPVEESVSSLAVASSFTFETAPLNISAETENLESNGEVSKLTNEDLTVSSSHEESDAQTTTNNGLSYDSDRIQLEKAVTKAQATYRGYLARRAFRTLKGIIRLQAVIRGHLVRRQAVATLYCVQGIVKFQALVRGQMIRHSDVGIEVRGKQSLAKRDADPSKVNTYSQEKLLKNAFIRQLLSSSPTVMPLRLQYDKEEPNSAWNWLLRWTVSHIWRPRCEPKKTIDIKQKVKTQKVGQKRSGKQSAHVTNASASPTTESVKLKHNPRKSINQSVKSVQKQPQKEIDEVRNETISDSDRDFKSMEEQTSNENHKIRKKRVPLPAMRDDQECEQQGTRVRSYMAATVSAKAKVRGQVSPRCGEDLTEKNGLIRRHSLPSSINGKVSSSPRVQRLTEASGKGGIKFDRSLSSSRDSNDKAIQAEWQR